MRILLLYLPLLLDGPLGAQGGGASVDGGEVDADGGDPS